MLAEAVKRLGAAVDKPKRRFGDIGNALWWWLDHSFDVFDKLPRLRLQRASFRLSQFTSDLWSDLYAILAVTDTDPKRRLKFEEGCREYGRAPIPAGNLGAIRKVEDEVRLKTSELLSEMELVLKQLTLAEGDEEMKSTSIDGFVPADTLAMDHGIQPQRLSEAAKQGKVRTKPAPRGQIDSAGKHIRILYDEQQAIKHGTPKKRKSR